MQNADVQPAQRGGGVRQKLLHNRGIAQRQQSVAPAVQCKRLLPRGVSRIQRRLCGFAVGEVGKVKAAAAFLQHIRCPEAVKAAYNPVGRKNNQPRVLHRDQAHHHIIGRAALRRLPLFRQRTAVSKGGFVPVMAVGDVELFIGEPAA